MGKVQTMEGIEASRLVNLPDELLQIIISYLDYKPDSLNLAYSCRRLCTVALPHVYSTITFNKLSTRLLSGLVHTLLRNPALARAVRSLTLTNENAKFLDERLENNYEVVTFDPGLITPIIDAACRSSTSRITWEEDLKSGVDEDPWLGLLLPFLPKLEKLHVDYFYEFLHQFKMIDHRARHMTKLLTDGPSSLFESLTEVSVMNVIPFDDPPETLVLFRLPNLRKFIGDQVVEIDNQFYPESEGDGGKDSSDDDYLETLDADSTDDVDDDDGNGIPKAMNDAIENAIEPQGYSTVTHIHFKRSISDFSFKRHILACAQLQSFIYEYYNASDCDQFDPASVHTYLVEHCNTLEDLALVQSNDNRARRPNKIMLPSLANFTALKRIWLRAPNLLGHNPQLAPKLVDRLPPTLEALWITDFDATDQRLIMVEQLKSVASAARTRFPRLRQMTVECACQRCKELYLGIPNVSTPTNGGASSSYMLYGPCREAGIELRVTDLVFPLSVRRRSID